MGSTTRAPNEGMSIEPFAPFAPLSPGSLVGVIAPAGPVAPDRLAAVPKLYDTHGLRCRIYPGCEQRLAYLAGPDDVRVADLHAALADPDIAAIHCIRGGYGAMRLLDRIDTALVRRARKLLIGYSDITALHALWAREGLPSLHAPMPASDLIHPGADADAGALFELLHQGLRRGDVLAPTVQHTPMRAELHRSGSAAGALVGGNLSLVASLLGTPFAWRMEGAILFLEDVNEDAYRADRYLTQLRLAGVFDAAAGFVLGSFTQMAEPTELLRDVLLPLNKPVLAGWPSGHGQPNRPLPMGLPVRLDAGAGTLTMLADFIATPQSGT